MVANTEHVEDFDAEDDELVELGPPRLAAAITSPSTPQSPAPATQHATTPRAAIDLGRDVLPDDGDVEYPDDGELVSTEAEIFRPWLCPLLGREVRGPFLLADDQGAPVLQVFEYAKIPGRSGVKRGGFLEAVGWDTSHALLRDLVGYGNFVVEVRGPDSRLLAHAVVSIAQPRQAYAPARAVVSRPGVSRPGASAPSSSTDADRPAWLDALLAQSASQTKALEERLAAIELENKRLREQELRRRDRELERLQAQARATRATPPAQGGQLSLFKGLREQLIELRETAKSIEEFRTETASLLGHRLEEAESSGDDDEAGFVAGLLKRLGDSEDFSEFFDDMFDSARSGKDDKGAGRVRH